jgi:DNA-directed RNA polymerase subunit RPC12/RpoP
MPSNMGKWLSGERYIATLCVGCGWPFQKPIEQRRIFCRACESKK